MDDQTKSKFVSPTPEEQIAFTKELDELLKKHSMIMQPALSATATAIRPEIRLFKIVPEAKIVIPEEKKPLTDDEKAVK